MSATDHDVFDRLPGRYAHAYLVVAFFLFPAVAVILSGGGVDRPPGPIAAGLLWAVVIHHSLFLVVAILFD